MRHRLPCLLLLSLPLLMACGRDTPASATDQIRAASAGDIPELEALRTESAKGPGFADWNGRLDQLLTQDMAAEVAGRPAAEAKKRNTVASSLSYSWKSDRTQHVQGMTVPRHDQVALTTLMSGVTREFFLSRFQTLTEEQKAHARQALDEHFGQDSAQNQDTAGGLMDVMSQRHPVEEVPGVGEAAMWEVRPDGQTLSIYHNTNTVDLVVNISDDPEVNKAASIALARQLIDRL